MYPSILIVDDDQAIRQSLSGILSDEGFEVSTAANGYEALQRIETLSPDLVLLDIWMQGIDGIETLKEIKKDNPHIQVILISGHGNVETAVKATKLGAFDLIEKPLSVDKVIVTIKNALNFRRLEEENRYLRKKTIEKHSITGNSPPIVALKKQINQAAPTDAWILITGENGTGKELVARTIHQLSARANHPWWMSIAQPFRTVSLKANCSGTKRVCCRKAPVKRWASLNLRPKGPFSLMKSET